MNFCVKFICVKLIDQAKNLLLSSDSRWHIQFSSKIITYFFVLLITINYKIINCYFDRNIKCKNISKFHVFEAYLLYQSI